MQLSNPLHRAAGLLIACGLAAGLTACAPIAPRTTTAAAVAHPALIDAGAVTAFPSVSVGSSTFALARRQGAVRFTASLDGGVPGTNAAENNWQLLAGPRVALADGITAGDTGNFTTQGVATAAGLAGSEVTGIDVITHAGTRVAAALKDGYYVAAWKGDDFSSRSTLDARFLLHLEDGSTRTLTYAQLPKD